MGQEIIKGKTMILLVSEKAQIPFLVGDSILNPYGEIDDVKGMNLLKAYPHFYTRITADDIPNIDLAKYSRVDMFENQKLEDVVKTLDKDRRVSVMNFIRTLFEPSKPPKISASPSNVEITNVVEPPKSVDNMSYAELKEFAALKTFTIPVTHKSKVAILAFIKEKLKESI